MTYVIASKTKKSVFISGDTAIKTTYLDPDTLPELQSETSSFNENHIVERNIKIEESRLKIFTIKGRLAIGIAGNVDNATRVVEKFHDLIAKEKEAELNTVENWIKEALFLCKADQLKGDKDFQLIIEFIGKDTPYLIS